MLHEVICPAPSQRTLPPNTQLPELLSKSGIITTIDYHRQSHSPPSQKLVFILRCDQVKFLFWQKFSITFSIFFPKCSKKIWIIFLIIQMMAVFSQFSYTVEECCSKKKLKKKNPGQSSGVLSFFSLNLQLFLHYPFLSLYFFT